MNGWRGLHPPLQHARYLASRALRCYYVIHQRDAAHTCKQRQLARVQAKRAFQVVLPFLPAESLLLRRVTQALQQRGRTRPVQSLRQLTGQQQ